MTAVVDIYNPGHSAAPLGQYSQIARVRASEYLFVAGMVSFDTTGRVVGEGDLDVQLRQTLLNIEQALRSAGAGLENIVQFTTYLVRPDLIAPLMEFRQREYPRLFPSGKYPPNTLLIVNRLIRAEFLVEIQTIAAI